MKEQATSKEILESLDFGKKSEEKEIISSIREQLGISEEIDLIKYVSENNIPPYNLLKVILYNIQPFALLVKEVYHILSSLGIRVPGNLNVLVPMSEAEGINLNLERYKHLEETIVEDICCYNTFDVGKLQSQGLSWSQFSDYLFKPVCYTDEQPTESKVLCDDCNPEHMIGQYERISELLQELKTQLLLDQADHDYPLDMLVESLEQFSERKSHCLSGSIYNCGTDFYRETIRKSIEELENSRNQVHTTIVKHFLSLPYWKKRWQLFEIWIVLNTLDSFGFDKLELEITNNEWILAVGGVDYKPIAKSSLHSRKIVEFYYQFQGVPPWSLYPSTKDRPEMIVRCVEPDVESNDSLIVIEAKAQYSFTTQNMEGALLPLLKWRPRVIAGLSFFSMGNVSGYVKSSINTGLDSLDPIKTDIYSYNFCQPNSLAMKKYIEMLNHTWSTILGDTITYIVIDTSGSMDEKLIDEGLDYVKSRLIINKSKHTFVVEFNDRATIYSFDEYNFSHQYTKLLTGGTNFTVTYDEIVNHIKNLDVMASHVFIHIISDLQMSENDLVLLNELAQMQQYILQIFTSKSEENKKLREEYHLESKIFYPSK